MNFKYISSQPHQPFFALGVINAIVFMSMFLLYYHGVLLLEITPSQFHSYSLIFLVFTPFFQGFLLTTFPRFSQTPPIEKKIYMKIFYAMLSATIIFLVGIIFSQYIILFSYIILLVATIFTGDIFYNIYKISPLPTLHDQFWILIGWSMGIVSQILFILYSLTEIEIVFSLAKNIGVYLYLIVVALSVGQRMIPFFSHVSIKQNKNLLSIVFTLLIFMTIFRSLYINVDFIFSILAGMLLAKEIYSWKLPFEKSEPILWILHLAIFWLPIALILGGIASIVELIFDQSFIFIQTHLIVLGFITTVLIGFGTRVTIGHSGNNMIIDKYTLILFYLTQILIYFRVLYSFSQYSIVFNISIAIWIGIFLAWSIKYFPSLLFGKKLN